MNRAAYAVLAAGAIVTAAAIYQLKGAQELLRQLRVETREFEDDRGRLVKLYLEARDEFRRMTSPIVEGDDDE